MKGWYEAPPGPRHEHEVARQMERETGLSFVRGAGLLLVVSAGSMVILFEQGPAADLSGSLWRIGALMILCASGRAVMASWRRRGSRIPSIAGYLVHRVRRLAPMHLISFALVAAITSGYAISGIQEQADISGLPINLIPLWPNVFAAQNNPAWFIIQTVVAGTLLIPVIALIEGHWGRLAAMGLLACLCCVLPDGTLWSISGIMLCAFTMGALAPISNPMHTSARTMIGTAALVLIAAGQAAGQFTGYQGAGGAISILGVILLMGAMTRRRSDGRECGVEHYAYPALVLHHPIIQATMVTTEGGAGGLLIGCILVAAATWICGRLIEKPNAQAQKQRTQAQEAAQRAADEVGFMLPYHPKKGDNRTLRQNGRRGK